MQIFILLWLCSVLFALIYSKTEVHELLNNYHSAFFDIFFQLLTFLGDGIFAVVICVFFFFFKGKKEGVLLLVTFLFSALLAQGFKNFVFADSMRPFFYIQAGELNVQTVKGVKMHMNHSFPSGHTTTIFAICSMLSLFYDSRKNGFLLLIIAVLTAYSRIYLSQHFFQDTVAGALLGVVASIFVYYIYAKKTLFPSNNSAEK